MISSINARFCLGEIVHKYFQHLLVVTLFSSSSFAIAQNTVGEILDAGGVKISKEKLIEQFSGRKVTGLSSSGKLQLNLEFKADGTMGGYVTSTEGHGTSGSFGKWTVDEAGKYCLDEQLSAWRINHRECWYGYKLGDDIFTTTTDSEDRATKVVKKVVSAK